MHIDLWGIDLRNSRILILLRNILPPRMRSILTQEMRNEGHPLSAEYSKSNQGFTTLRAGVKWDGGTRVCSMAFLSSNKGAVFMKNSGRMCNIYDWLDLCGS